MDGESGEAAEERYKDANEALSFDPEVTEVTEGDEDGEGNCICSGAAINKLARSVWVTISNRGYIRRKSRSWYGFSAGSEAFEAGVTWTVLTDAGGGDRKTSFSCIPDDEDSGLMAIIFLNFSQNAVGGLV